jgi:hypothetical protein
VCAPYKFWSRDQSRDLNFCQIILTIILTIASWPVLEMLR